MEKQYMGIDQYGETYHALGPYPRKALMEKIGVKSARNMYVDSNGLAVHVGYVVGRHWCRIYEVREWRRV